MTLSPVLQRQLPALLAAAIGNALWVPELGNSEGYARYLYLILGSGSSAITPVRLDDEHGSGRAMIDVAEEGHFDAKGGWVMERRWNGDQVDWGLNFTSQPRVLKVKMGRYQ